MTLILDLDLDVLKMYLHTKNEVCRSRHSTVRAQTGQTDTQTDWRDWWYYHPSLAGGKQSYGFITQTDVGPSCSQSNRMEVSNSIDTVTSSMTSHCPNNASSVTLIGIQLTTWPRYQRCHGARRRSESPDVVWRSYWRHVIVVSRTWRHRVISWRHTTSQASTL